MATWKQIAFLDEVANLSDVAALSVGTATAAGTGTEASREDHVHDLGAACIDAAALFAADVVDKAALAADVAGLGITQAAGGELDVNVDDSTLEVSVDVVQVKDAGIVAAKLATDSVETIKIKDLNVTAGKLAADSVETAKILDLNVTGGKIAADAVDDTKIADDAVGSEHIEALSADLDFAGNEATDLALHNSATDPATPVLGKIYFKTGDTHPYICTAVA